MTGKGKYRIGIFLLILICLVGCKSLDHRKTVLIEDRDMDFDAYYEQGMEENIYTYRESAAGGTSGKSGGGCGCN